VSEAGKIIPIDAGSAAPIPSRSAPKGTGRTLWFGWWAAICLVAVAYLTYGQLAAQRRILVASEQLKAKVGEAAAVSAATNQQLGKVAELDAGTKQLADKLQRVATINTAIKGELGALEGTVAGLQNSVSTLDQQAVQSHETLNAIAAQSDALLATLRHSRQTGEQVSAKLSRMLELQNAINADLAEMNRNTKDLERFVGGGD
jgi:methyl-accepting chemotaxis protein